MPFSYKRGRWNDVQYVLGYSVLSEEAVQLSVHVHKDLLDYPEQEFETRVVSFLGYEWTACVTVKRDGYIRIVWRLCSPVSDRAPQRCSWEIVDPIQVPGASRPFVRNGRYGGICPLSQADVNGFIVIVFRLQLDAPSGEGLTIYEGASDTCCVWRLRRRLDEVASWTDNFSSHGRKWGLCLHVDCDSNVRLDVEDSSTADIAEVNCRALVLDPFSPELSRILSRMVLEEQYLHFFSKNSQRCEGNGENSSDYDGWLRLGLHFSFPKETSDLPEDFYPLEKPRVMIEVLTDEHIKEYMEQEASMDVFAASGTHVYLCPPNQSLKSVIQMIRRDSRSDASQLSIWLGCAQREGMYSRPVYVDALEELDLCLCELCEPREKEGRWTVCFYLRSNENAQPLRPLQGSVLLFCVLLDSQSGKLEYLGSILADGDVALCTICFINIHNLCERLRDLECAFFVMKSGNDATKIRRFQKTVRESGLTSGSVMIVRPLAEAEAVNADRLCQELQNLRQDRQRIPETGSEHLCHNNSLRQRASCIASQGRTQTYDSFQNKT